MSEPPPEPRFRISIEILLAFAALMGTGFGAWSKLDTRVTNLEANTGTRTLQRLARIEMLICDTDDVRRQASCARLSDHD